MSTERKVEIGRLAMRAEGNFWNAYFALHQHTMEGAILLGSIRLSSIEANHERKAAFMELMRGIVSEAIKDTSGVAPTWGSDRPAPENERSGRA